MTDIIIHKHSTSAGDAPEPAELSLGELAIQAADGHIYLKKTDSTINRVTMLPGGTQQQVLYKTGAGDYALGWGTITSTLIGGALWSEVVAEVQRVFALVEGTASVLLSAPATLTAGSTGPITVSVADTAYLTDGTSITGVLGTVYGTLSRSGSTYSFESVQSYTGDVNFATGTRFAAAFLNDTFNPLRVGNAELEEGLSYDYAAVELDEQNRISRAIKDTGEQYIPKLEVDVLNAKNLATFSDYADFNVDATAGTYLIRAISPTGSDTDDGSISAPWQTLTKLKTWIAGLPNPSKVKILIKAGSYSETVANPLYFQTSGLYSEVYFEEGVSITMVQVGTTTLSNAVGADKGEHYFYLNGATITLSKASDYPTISDNGVGVHGGKVYVNGLTKTNQHASFVGFIDGTSNHNSGYLELTGCDFSGTSKGAYSHVNTCTSKHFDCVFEGTAGTQYEIGEVEAASYADFTRCTFLSSPSATAPQKARVRNGTLTNCQIGSSTQSVWLQAQNVKVEDCYLNLLQDFELGNTTYRNCFGKYTNRNTSGNANEARMLSCVFIGPGSFAPASRFFQSSVNFGKFFILNSILTGYDQVIDVGGNAGRIALVNGWVLNGLCLFNNSVNFDSGITNPSILVTSDPLLGSANTMIQRDYEIGSGSPCRYTGVNNSNIGLPQETP